MIYLKKIVHKKKTVANHYPYNIPAIQTMDQLDISQPITFFIGDNGSGKTTLLETLVCMTKTVNLIDEDKNTMSGPRKLAKDFDLVWQQKSFRGFYLKAQSFIYFIKQLDLMKREANQALEDLKDQYADRSPYAYTLAKGPYIKTLHALETRYEKSLSKLSHGQAYLELFKSRLVPGGLYILDEPELSLSPHRQLSLMALIKDMIKKDCQFIIITHSPILMALDQSTIYSFDDHIIRALKYQDVPHVQLTRDFLNHPEAYLKHL